MAEQLNLMLISKRSFAGFAYVTLLMVSIMLVGTLPLAHAFANGSNASLVLGQAKFSTAYTSSNQMGLAGPRDVVMDRSGDLWVADAFDNRILEYQPPFSNGMNASLVIGQAGFGTVSSSVSSGVLSFPSGLAFDAAGDLWVADTGNSRVLEFTPPFVSGMAASLVIGQPSFDSAAPRTTASGLDSPTSVAFDSAGNLWVVDSGNNRLLEFTSPFSSGMSASLVLGQAGFTSSLPSTSQSGLSQPQGAFAASGGIWVADSGNNRVIEFDPPYSSGMSASLVLGQATYSTAAAATSQSGMSYPLAVTIDSQGNLWVSDSRGARVLEFEQPFSDGMNASFVVGHPDFTTSTYSVSESSVKPAGLAFDSQGNLWVSDTGANRILEFAPPFAGWMNAAKVIGQPGFYTSYLPTSSLGMSSPRSIAISSTDEVWVTDTGDSRLLEFKAPFSDGMNASSEIGAPSLESSLPSTAEARLLSPDSIAMDGSGDLWVADTLNNRILEFKAPLESGMNASLVIGQVDFTQSTLGTAVNKLVRPSALAFDSAGDLWVADSGNNRILEYKAPFETGMFASLVLGQQSFTTGGAGSGQSGLSEPSGLAFDPAGDLWVSDTGNDRVVDFTPPFSSGMGASTVLGQAGFSAVSSGDGASELSAPNGIAFDSSGDLWVADTGNNRVVEFLSPFSTGMAASSVIGQLGFGVSTPSTSQSGLSVPSGVAFDSHGDLWVADTGNDRIVMFSPPAVTTSSTTTVTSTSSNSTSSTSRTTTTNSTSSTSSSVSTTSSTSTTSQSTSSSSTSSSSSSSSNSTTTQSSESLSTSSSSTTSKSSTALSPSILLVVFSVLVVSSAVYAFAARRRPGR